MTTEPEINTHDNMIKDVLAPKGVINQANNGLDGVTDRSGANVVSSKGSMLDSKGVKVIDDCDFVITARRIWIITFIRF
jgi:hypothetical protein